MPELRRWLVAKLADYVGEVDPERTFDSYGLTSRDAVQLAGELEELLDQTVPASLLYEFPTINALAARCTATSTAGPGMSSSGLAAPTPVLGREPVAVVGVGCRLPGAAGPEEFWRLLAEGHDATHEVPPGRWDSFAEESPAVAALLGGVPARGGFLDDIAGFDADFFTIAPREAAAMDPQQRLVLEVVWEALRHAAIPSHVLAGSRTGVFIGASAAEYANLQMSDLATINPWMSTGSSLSIIANRVSYLLGLHGPSLVVDSACSGSLVAVHLAVQSLRMGESDLAMAGGVNLLISPAVTINFQQSGAMAPDGRCKTFDAAADGYGRGEGCGVVLLKRLSDALRDGDRVLAVIRGSAVNQDGASNGLMAPNPRAQQDVLRAACADAAVEPLDIDYVEAHGTGTVLGDEIETSALAAVLAEGRPPGRPLLIGSVKTNLAHLEAAAGVAGLIKTILGLSHRVVPPSLNFDQPNPSIRFAEAGLRVVTEPTPWPSGAGLAGVSSFGFGGTNAHVIVAAPPPDALHTAPEPGGARVFAIPSARVERVADEAARLAEWLETTAAHAPAGASPALADIGYTLSRQPGTVRGAVVAASHADLLSGLRALAEGEPAPGVAAPSPGRWHGPVWMFSGQGSQWPGMGRGLLRAEPAFAAAVDELEPIFLKETGFSLREVIEGGLKVTDIDRVQPVLYGLQICLAALWRAHGVSPAAVIGHSMGEAAAAVVAGALNREEGLAVIARRSRLLARIAGQGSMAAVELPAVELRRRLAGLPGVEVAVISSPAQTIVSGDSGQVAMLMERLTADGVEARLVRVDVASHSAQVVPILDDLGAELAGLRGRLPAIPFYSTVTANPREAPSFDSAYWADNLRRPVRFREAVEAAAADGFTCFTEISPHPLLTQPALDTLQTAGVEDPFVQFTLLRNLDDNDCFRTRLAESHAHGLPEDLTGSHPGGRVRDLPPIAWRHTRHWAERRPAAPKPASAARPGTFLGLSSFEIAGSTVWWADLPAEPPAAVTEILLNTALHVAYELTGRADVTDLRVLGPPRNGDGARFEVSAGSGGIEARVTGEGGAPLPVLTATLPSEPGNAPGPAPGSDVGLLAAMLDVTGATRREPLAIDRLTLHAEQAEDVALRLTRRPGAAADVAAASGGGEPVLTMTGLRVSAGDVCDREPVLYEMDWGPAPPAPPLIASVLLVAEPTGPLADALADDLRAEKVHFARTPLDRPVVEGLAGDGPVAAVVVAPESGTAPHAGEAAHRVLERVAAAARHVADAGLPRLWLVLPGESPAPVHAPVAGWARTFEAAHPAIAVGVVHAADARGLAALVRGEHTPLAALRDGERLEARLVPVARPLVASPLSCSPDGAYLLTGHDLEARHEVARMLSARGARFLVFTGAPALPPRDAWPDSPDDDPPGRHLRLVRELARTGVMVRTLDHLTDDPEALRDLLRGLEREGWPPIRGAVHVVGGAPDTPLQSRLATAWAVERALAGRSLDFLTFLTPASGALAEQGTAEAAAEAAFAEALADAVRRDGRPATCVGLPLGDPCGGVVTRPRDALLAWDHARRCAVSWALALPPLPPEARTGVSRLIVDPGSGPGWAAMPKHERRRLLLDQVIEIIAREMGLGRGQLDPARALAESGLDSIMGLTIRNRLRQVTGVELSATTLWNYPTPLALAGHLADLLGGSAESAWPAPDEGNPWDELLKAVESGPHWHTEEHSDKHQ
ncbi:acyltransferase domain-containing protein [Nonomuraea sp. NPDC003707]